MKKYILVAIYAIAHSFLFAQATKVIKGEIIDKQSKETLPNASVYWLGTTIGTSTDFEGIFELKTVQETDTLVVSYLGYKEVRVKIESQKFLKIKLENEGIIGLGEVSISKRRKSTSISRLTPIKAELINEKELLKAACCNLSESFETSPTVDVSFTDAVTGTRQIQMLGLAGTYTQITRESMPSIRGLSSMYGLTFVPGTWIKGIQLIKGAGSVVNGFESIAGQINVELRKPEDDEKVYLNLYGNQGGRLEANANLANKVSERWSTATLLHYKTNQVAWDKNNDTFLDMPLGENFIALNRWRYVGANGLRFQLGVKAVLMKTDGGQHTDFTDTIPEKNLWKLNLETKRFEGWMKLGKVYEDMPWKSVALQISGANHEQVSTFGKRVYNATQQTFYANSIYQSLIGNTFHNFKTGVSFQYDEYEENLDSLSFNRKEVVPGAYFEYTFSPSHTFDLVLGIREDYHNTYGAFTTPRLHSRFEISESAVLRASAGRGQRTANVLAENNALFASSRSIQILGDGSDKPFGLNPEVAWNYGLNFTQCFTVNGKEGTISFDLYRTDFENQIVLDVDANTQQALFYNLKGKSYSNSFQTQVDYELFERFDVRVAYRWFDVKTDYISGTLQKPMVSTHRTFANIGYETNNKWKFDYTVNWQGEKRLPQTVNNPLEYQLSAKSPSFWMMSAQISKQFSDRFEVYLGMENILNFKQENPILAANNPNGKYFDSSMVWGPIFGRNTYAGLRYRIK